MSISCSGNVFRYLFTGLCLLAVPSCGPSLPVLVSSTPTQVSIEYEPKKGVRSTSELAEEACAKEGRRSQFVASEGNIVKYDCVRLALPAIVSATADQVAVEFDPTVGVHSTRALAEDACADVRKPAQFKSVEGSIAFYDCLEIAVPEQPVMTPSSSTRGAGNENLAVLAFWPSGAYDGLQAEVGSFRALEDKIKWQPTREIDLFTIANNGSSWSIDIANDDIIGSAFMVPNIGLGNGTGTVHYRFGRMVKSGQKEWVVGWGPRIVGIEDNEWRGISIALNNEWLLVEISERGKDLYYRVGELKQKKLEFSPETCVDETGSWKKECYYYDIMWRKTSPTKYGRGKYPSVALMDDGTLVEVHYTSAAGTKLWYNVGEIKNEKIEWRTKDITYANGRTPSVAVTPDGRLIEIHKDKSDDYMWYRLGRVRRDKKEIEWTSSEKEKKMSFSMVYPSVTVRSDGVLMISFIDKQKKRVHYSLGQANSSWSNIQWGGTSWASSQYVYFEGDNVEPNVPQIILAPK